MPPSALPIQFSRGIVDKTLYVIRGQAKDADACSVEQINSTDTGLDQKVRGQVQVFLTHLTQTSRHRQRGET